MRKKRRLISLIILGLTIMIINLCFQTQEVEASREKVVFSWEPDRVEKGGKELFDLLEKVGANVVYQNISADASEKTVKRFLKNAFKRGISVYLLEGHTDWSFDNDKSPYVNVVKRVEAYNQLVKKKYRIKGVVFDIEPYTLEEWDEEKEVLMNNYVTAMKKTYKVAKKKNISMVACIPYFYEDLGMKKEMKDLIQNACDEVAVMNYYRKNEIKHIKNEAKYALKYDKKLINIYEFNPAGTYGLIDINTYYDLGLSTAEKKFKKIKKKYKDQEVYMGLHEAEILKELVENEKK